jgi:type II secretory pathway predicted ATPase ExeA
MAADAEFAHLPQDVRPIAALDAEARIAHIRAERWVQNPAADRVLGYLHEASTQPRRERMENILLIGESGMGKTMLIRKFERQTAVAFDDGAGVQQRPVVVMLMPHEPTERAFFVQLLQAMHAPAGGHLNSRYPVQAVVMRLLGELQTRLVVIDEINSVLAGTPRQQRIFLQLLRFMSNELRLAFVGVGVPEARHALLSDSQLRSRFTDVELLPWTDGEVLRGFVNRLAWSLPLREPSPVDSAKLRRLLVERTGGVTLGICKGLERAAIAAIRGGTERIGLESFDDPEIWRGVAAPTRDTRPQGRAGAVRQGA